MWKDWPESEATWELESNLTNCVELLEQFSSMMNKKEGSAKDDTHPSEKNEEICGIY